MHDTEIAVTLEDGTRLAAASGYRTRRANAELGNGFSFSHGLGHACPEDDMDEFHLGYVFIRR
jgi:hypothetical protein